MKRFFAIPVLVLAACATGETSSQTPSGQRGPLFSRSEAPDPGPLTGIGIPSGECGMVLWSRSGGRVAPIFRAVGGTRAVMKIEGEDVPLTLQAQEGDMRIGIRARQIYAGEGLSVTTKVRWGQNFPGGTYVESGSITVGGSDGWSRVLPVAGIAGCKR